MRPFTKRRDRDETERVPAAFSSGNEATGNWLRSIRFSGFSIMVLSLIVLFIVVLAPGLKIYLEQRQQVAELEAAVAAQEAEIDSLQDERARYNDPAYLKAEIRDRLFYVMPGETSFLVIDDLGEVASAETMPVSENLQETRVDWVSTLFGSVMTAGLSDVPPDELTTTESTPG
ncbi:FtsB family cell division protein [Planctomonas psychrotolerans]|uniref:FtsB family cell division protein n=1 Tax=Planctomonas psychrotolerans TaxID=2528712 RepID=UPI00123BF5E3|nr:septum formation initiator family protein [Planctomonas psychrotolerans]